MVPEPSLPPPPDAAEGQTPPKPRFNPDLDQQDSLAKQEAAALAVGDDLEHDGKQKEHRRHQTFRDHVNRAAMLLFWAIVLGLAWGITALAWHLLMPAAWHYLDKDQLDRIQTILVSALFSSALSGYVSKRMA